MDRVSKFNDMITTTNDHIKAVQEAATKFKDSNDPIGLGLEVAGATSGGVTGVAGAVSGIQHFKDFKTMYKGIAGRLNNVRSRINTAATNNNITRGGGANQPDPTSSSGSNSADGNAPKPQAQANSQANSQAPANNGSGGADVDGGLQPRIDDLENNVFPNTEADQINNAINAKVTDELGLDGRAFLNKIAAQSNRGGDADFIRGMPEGDLKTDAQKDFLNFKNKVANDAIQRNQSGKTPASGYDKDGNPTGDVAGPQPKPVNQAPDQSNVNVPDPQNNVNLAPDPNAPQTSVTASGDVQNVGANLDPDAQGIVAQGRAALSNLVGGQQVPSRMGGQVMPVRGLRVNGPGGSNDPSAQANAGARIQQQSADNSQNSLAPGRNPNGSGNAPSAGNQPGANVDGNTGGQGGVNPGQGGSAGANSADGNAIADGSNAAKAAAGAGGDIAEGLGEGAGIGEGLEAAAAFSGPAAPIIGLIGGLVSLGTTIAGLFHKKPPPQKVAPPPAPTTSVGGNLKDTLSGMGGGIF